MMILINYIIQYLPVLIAILSETVIAKLVLKYIAQIKDTKEYKQLIVENRLLRTEIKKQNEKLNELMTVVDKVARKPEEV